MSAEASLVFPVQSTVACEGCDTDVDVIWFCKNCAASLCTTCKEKHSKEKFLRNHLVVKRSGSVLLSHGAWKIAQPCQKHKGKEISTYCNDCGVPCCVECLEERHRRHDFTTIEKKYMGAEARLNNFVKELEKKTIQNMKSDIAHLNKVLESCTVDYEAVKKDVEKFRNKLKSTVDQSCDVVIKELDQKLIQSSLQLQNNIKDVDKRISDVGKLIQEVETRIRKGGLAIIEYHPAPPPSRPHTYSDTFYLRPQFVPDDKVIGMLSTSIGKVSYEEVKVEKEKEKEMVRIPSIDTTAIRSFKAEIIFSRIEPVGNDTAWVSYDESEKVYLYDISGKVVKSIPVKDSQGINDITVKRTGDLIVTCEDKKVRHVSMTGKITVLMNAQPLSPRGVCLTDNEEIVVCMAWQGDKNHVAMYTPDGKRKIRNIVAKDDSGKLYLSDPCRVVMNGECVTVLNDGSNILNVNQSGKMMWVYDGSQTKLSKAFTPVGMCKDKYSNILISDLYNHYVHCLNREGKLLQIVIKQENGIKSPWGLGLSRDTEKLWLGSSEVKTIWVMPYAV